MNIIIARKRIQYVWLIGTLILILGLIFGITIANLIVGNGISGGIKQQIELTMCLLPSFLPLLALIIGINATYKYVGHTNNSDLNNEHIDSILYLCSFGGSILYFIILFTNCIYAMIASGTDKDIKTHFMEFSFISNNILMPIVSAAITAIFILKSNDDSTN